MIVGLKGDSGDVDLRTFNSCGADEVLPKPFNMEDLDDIMRRFDERKRGEVSAQAAKAADQSSLSVLVVDDSSSTRCVCE